MILENTLGMQELSPVLCHGESVGRSDSKVVTWERYTFILWKYPTYLNISEGQADYSKTFPTASVFWVSILSKEAGKDTEIKTSPGLDL